ncbi:hypothetical protein LCL89_03130 [Halobacillus yeomjeoni]|uniref:sporulation protein YpjB n=1 Tax=Halobacillus yeomjeoni TaxID=311194 RepID=UPI001CD42411|nr:sporulation protein YpjB [Halobacillus yeomjeoni]MCA0983037.1 hypothetical protein [Halobacillus yeomjeoni]
MLEDKNQWQSFTDQYRWLIEDGKFELAERMLHRRLPHMEQYIKTLKTEEQTVWRDLLTVLLQDEGTPTEKDVFRFQMMVNVSTAPDPIVEAGTFVQDLKGALENPFASIVKIESQWEVIAPMLDAYYEKEAVSEISEKIRTLSHEDTFYTREAAIEAVGQLLDAPEEIRMDALWWTAFLVGGTIVLTLFYVALQKMKANQRQSRSKRRDNS